MRSLLRLAATFLFFLEKSSNRLSYALLRLFAPRLKVFRDYAVKKAIFNIFRSSHGLPLHRYDRYLRQSIDDNHFLLLGPLSLILKISRYLIMRRMLAHDPEVMALRHRLGLDAPGTGAIFISFHVHSILTLGLYLQCASNRKIIFVVNSAAFARMINRFSVRSMYNFEFIVTGQGSILDILAARINRGENILIMLDYGISYKPAEGAGPAAALNLFGRDVFLKSGAGYLAGKTGASVYAVFGYDIPGGFRFKHAERIPYDRRGRVADVSGAVVHGALKAVAELLKDKEILLRWYLLARLSYLWFFSIAAPGADDAPEPGASPAGPVYPCLFELARQGSRRMVVTERGRVAVVDKRTYRLLRRLIKRLGPGGALHCSSEDQDVLRRIGIIGGVSA